MQKLECPYCKKILEGYTLNQVNYMAIQHTLSKHKDKLPELLKEAELLKKKKKGV